MRKRRPPAVPAEPARLGALGWLDMRIDVGRLNHEGEYLHEASGLYRYVGIVNGHYAFAPATSEPVVYLEPDELVNFNERRDTA